MNDLLSHLIRWSLILLIVVTPWCFGGVFASTQSMLLAAASLLLLVDFIRTTMSTEDRRYIPTLILILFAGILLGIVQLIPLGPAFQSIFAPRSTSLRAELIGSTASSSTDNSEAAESAPRSLYPASTRENLALLFLATAVCYLAAVYLKDSRSLLILFSALAICGVALGFFGIVQKISSTEKIYWQMPLTYGGAIFGPYVNRNNAGGFLNLCVAGALGLLVYLTSRSDHDESYEHWSDSGQRHRTYHAESPLLVQLNALGIALLIGLGFLAGAVIISASRGSMLALIAATLVVAGMLLFQSRNRRSAWPLILALGAGVPLMAWAGQTEAIQARLGSIFGDGGQIQDARLANWPDALSASGEFRFGGSGLGTYRYIYGLKQQWFLGEKWFFHAENQFIESLVDGGLIGLLLLASAISLVGFGIVRLYRIGRRADTALAVAGAYALVSQIVGGTFDFGLYIPANMMLMAAICGSVTGRTASLQPAPDETNDRPDVLAMTRLVTSGWAMPLVGGLLLLGCFFGTIELRRLARIEAITWETPLEVLREQRESEPIEQLISRLQPVLRQRWDDAEAHRYMADLWMQLYRARTYSRLKLQLPPTDEAEADLIWDRAALWQLHGAIRSAERLGQDATLLKQEPVVVQTLQTAQFHLVKSRAACPLIAHVHYALAELSAAVEDDPDVTSARSVEIAHLERATQLAPGDATLFYWAGVLDENSGRYRRAIEKWTRSLQLGETIHRRDIAARLANQPPERLSDLPDDPVVLAAVALNPDLSFEVALPLLLRADEAFTKMSLDAVGNHAHSQVLLALARADRDDLDATQLTAEQQKFLNRGIDRLEHSVQQDSTRERWRLNLTELLLSVGRAEDAHRHARMLARTHSNNRRYLELLKRVNRERRK